MVMTPALEKPDSACDGEMIPETDSATMAPRSTISVGEGVVASRMSTARTTATVNQTSQPMKARAPPTRRDVSAYSA